MQGGRVRSKENVDILTQKIKSLYWRSICIIIYKFNPIRNAPLIVKIFNGLYNYVIYGFIKWSGILPNFALSWLVETCFPRQYLRVSTPQMLNDGLFGVSVMSQRKRRFSCQIFAWTGEFGVHFLMTSQYTHLISRRFWLGLTTPWTFLCD